MTRIIANKEDLVSTFGAATEGWPVPTGVPTPPLDVRRVALGQPREQRPGLYIAGPDVFRPDAEAFYARVRQLCNACGWDALCPGDYTGDLTNPKAIFEHNVRQLKECSAVIANVNPWRGSEPDSGTVWEVGFAFALGKPVYLYQDHTSKVKDLVRYYFEQTATKDNCEIEDFGFTVNLMLQFGSTTRVFGYVDNAIYAACEKVAA